jgi:hypothetical protein
MLSILQAFVNPYNPGLYPVLPRPPTTKARDPWPNNAPPSTSAVFHAHRHRMVALAATHRLPVVSRIPGFAEAGGLIQCGDNALAMVRRAAIHCIAATLNERHIIREVESSDKALYRAFGGHSMRI